MKRLLSLLALVLMTISMSAQSVRGDLNGDGEVTTTDVTELYNIIFGTATPQEENLSLNVGCISLNMVPVKGGTFQMGGISSNERPTHSVTLSDYYIGETEVTQALWESVMGSNPSNFKGLNRPVEQVSWYDCQIFISKLNSLMSSQLPTGYRFRLPTEAEWEFAARGGTQSNGYTYSGSNSINEVACYNDNQTHDVATKAANELGIYDLSGNVFEWCQDWFGDYSSDDQINPTGPVSGSSRVFRGGCCTSDARDCRVYSRNGWTPSGTASDLGLRLVLSDQRVNLTFSVGDVVFTMVAVDGGTFQMGSTSGGSNAQHSVILSDYFIGETEVTQALWQAVMGSNPSQFSGTQRPVEKVSWDDCLTFISKLNELTGMTFRLPTEAEWEFAARGGTKSNGYLWSGSNTIDDVAWFNVNSFIFTSGIPVYQTHDVATKAANELGIYDMSGNVFEWCQDWYGDYSSDTQYDPTGIASGSTRVVRGGCYINGPNECTVSYRANSSPEKSGNNMGLRLAL